MGTTASFKARAKLVGTGLLIALGILEGFAVLASVLKAPIFPTFISQHAGVFAAVLNLPLAAAFGYLIWRAQRNDRSFELEPKDILCDPWGRRAGIVLTSYLAMFMGVALTVLAFGADGPFGHIMQGIQGPRLPIDVSYWPLVFLAGMLLVLHFALVVHAAMKEEYEKQGHRPREAEK